MWNSIRQSDKKILLGKGGIPSNGRDLHIRRGADTRALDYILNEVLYILKRRT